MPVLLKRKPETETDAAVSEQTEHAIHPKLRGRLPEKRTINLATVNVRRIDWRIGAPALVLVLAVVAVFGKFAVVDQLSAAAVARSEVAALQSRLDEGNGEIRDFGEINDLYAHYTYSGMTAEELERIDRVAIMELIQRVVLPLAPVDKWSVSGNYLELDIEGKTLQEINQIVQLLLGEDMVDYCTVTTASGSNAHDSSVSDIVTANVYVQLRRAEQEAKQ